MSAWRPATADDEEQVVSMCLTLYAEDPGPNLPTPEGVQETFALFQNDAKRGRVVVLDVLGLRAGYAFLVLYWSNELNGDICLIDELYVQLPWRGRGYATQLPRELQAGSFFERPPVALELETTPTNTKAQALYQRLGFSVKRNTGLRLLTNQALIE